MPAQQQASVMMGSAAPGSLSCVDACNQIFNNDRELLTFHLL